MNVDWWFASSEHNCFSCFMLHFRDLAKKRNEKQQNVLTVQDAVKLSLLHCWADVDLTGLYHWREVTVLFLYKTGKHYEALLSLIHNKVQFTVWSPPLYIVDFPARNLTLKNIYVWKQKTTSNLVHSIVYIIIE